MRRVLFVDRDGTLVVERKSLAEPVEQPLIAGVIPALLRLKAAGYQFVIVTNQPGLGSSRQHLLGTTALGQDIFAQLVYGTRQSLVIALVLFLVGLVSRRRLV